MLRTLLAASLFLLASALHAEATGPETPAELQESLALLVSSEAPLNAARTASLDCEAGCITPSEAVALAFEAGEGEGRSGRFILDIRGGGQSLSGELERLLFVSSQQDYARLGTLTIAFDPDALYNLLRRARVCGAHDVSPGRIDVKACRRDVNFDLNMFTMMQRLSGRRIVVDGEVRLQWIDSRFGTPRPVTNRRGENELGYYQVWVRVDDADQVIFVYDD